MLSKIAPECFLESNVWLDSSFFEIAREIGSADCFGHFSPTPFRDRCLASLDLLSLLYLITHTLLSLYLTEYLTNFIPLPLYFLSVGLNLLRQFRDGFFLYHSLSDKIGSFWDPCWKYN